MRKNSFSFSNCHEQGFYLLHLGGGNGVAWHRNREGNALADGPRVDLAQLGSRRLCLGLTTMQAVLKLIK